MFGGPKDGDDCPLWKGPCRKHNCRWWVTINGTNPNTGVHENKGDCAMAWLPFLVIENSHKQVQTGASTDKVATEIKKFHDNMASQNAALHRLALGHTGDEKE